MIRFISTIILGFVFYPTIQSQSDLRIGEWEEHLPKDRCIWVTQSENEVYINTGNAIINLNKEEVLNGDFIEPGFITKIDGLTESAIDKIAYDSFNDQLIVIYSTSNIDIIKGGEIINLSFIKDNNNLVGSREINEVHIVDGTCYLACAFGLINVNLQDYEVRYTTFTPSPVQTVSSNENRLFIGLEDGIYAIAKNDINPIDFGRWVFQGENAGLPIFYDCTALSAFNGKIYAIIDGVVYEEQEMTFQEFVVDVTSGFENHYLSSEGDHLIVGQKNSSNFTAEIKAITREGQVIEGGAGCAANVISAIESSDGKIWYADEYRGIRYTDGIDFGCNTLTFSGPRALTASQIVVTEDRVLFASGGATDNYGFLSNRDGIYILENNNWTNINEREYPIINQNDFINFVSVAMDPNEEKVWMASYYSGLVSFHLETEELEFFDGSNTNQKIQGITPGEDKGRVAYVAFDEEDNLWLSNFGAQNPIVVRDAAGFWHHFPVPTSNKNLAEIAVDDRGYIWFTVIGNNGGVIVYDKGESLPDPNDDRIKLFTTANSSLPSPLINSIAVDLGGDVWVGTAEGPVVFECDPFDDQCDASIRKVVEDNIAALLLETEEVISIDVDGANQKWFGTKNGIFVQSADAQDKVAKYDEDNSPLFSNTILDLDYDPAEGRMYISTNNGIQSVRTESTGAKLKHDRTVFAFPNPVQPNYNGPIAIKGLGQNANVKITDLAGKLVYETTALGGQAIWDGRDYNGRKAASGVYLVFSSSKVSFDQSDDYVTKIMLLD
jgi:hypothetical protein